MQLRKRERRHCRTRYKRTRLARVEEINQYMRAREEARFYEGEREPRLEVICRREIFLFQILLGQLGTRLGGSAFVQSVAAGSAAQVGVFDMQHCQGGGRQPLFVQQR